VVAVAAFVTRSGVNRLEFDRELGAILLIHPNGHEHLGLRLFVKLLSKGKLPRPFRPINDAP
jgi:hypothetical protein